MKICVCTPHRADGEPRGPRHAHALAELYPKAEIIFIDCAPEGFQRVATPVLSESSNLQWITHFYPTKQRSFTKLMTHRVATNLAEIWYRLSGKLTPAIFSSKIVGLTSLLKKQQADVIHAHNIELLLPAFLAVRPGGKVIFDCMEFYSDMGEGQTRLFCKAVIALEKKYVPLCFLLTTSSPQVSQAYREAYNIKYALSLYNCPSQAPIIIPSNSQPLRLYWRNSVLGLSQRGLGEALDALIQLPSEITLHLQGRLSFDNGATLRKEIVTRKLENRVFILPPHGPDQGVQSASPHSIGLCMEQAGNRNHQLTVSNKIFDYMMAGLAVIASDLPGLRQVIETSEGGLLFTPGSSKSLSETILYLYEHPLELSRLRYNARVYATQEGNRSNQMQLFKNHLAEFMHPSK